MKMSRPGKMSSLRDIAFERERLRYLALRTELELKGQLKNTRQIFSFKNILSEMQRLAFTYLKNSVKRIFS